MANINQFAFSGAGVLAEGGGSIDLGNQYVDFSLRPRLTGRNANDLAAFGIPIKMSGKFGSIKVGLDTDLLGQVVAERAAAKAASLIQERVGGSLGGVLGGVIGGGNQPLGSSSSGGGIGNILGGVIGGNQAPQPTGTQQPQSQQDQISGLLGGILGGNQAPTQQPQPGQPAPKKEEPKIEDVFGGLFGKKKN